MGMMNIETMSDSEKSVMLARLCGWNVELLGDDVWVSNSDNEYLFSVRLAAPKYLYNYKWMFLAWRVLNWAGSHFRTVDYMEIHNWFWMSQNWRANPADAQRAWLDKILTLAMAAGMVTE